MSVPNTNNFSLLDVIHELYGPNVSSGNLAQCFADAHGTFDSRYVGSKDRLSNFKNYNDRVVLYGLTSNGGHGYNNGSNTFANGVLFGYSNQANDILTVTNFVDAGPNAAYPMFQTGDLMVASDGMMYGLTHSGGDFGTGTIFKYNPITRLLTIIHSFYSSSDGQSPFGSLVEYSGILYGMTNSGGANDYGTLFSYEISNSTFTKLKDFNGVGYGANPTGSLIVGSENMLYGLTSKGGTNNYGTVIQYSINYNLISKCADFDGVVLGANPQGSLMLASNGNMYGLTSYGGTTNSGTLFMLDLSLNISKKYDFIDNVSGSKPYGSLIQASNGLLYGLTNSFSGGYGSLFQYDIPNDILTKKQVISSDGSWHPHGSLVQGSDGMLYGTTSGYTSTDFFGPSENLHDNGSIFQYDIASDGFPWSYNFPQTGTSDYANGRTPCGTLIQYPKKI